MELEVLFFDVTEIYLAEILLSLFNVIVFGVGEAGLVQSLHVDVVVHLSEVVVRLLVLVQIRFLCVVVEESVKTLQTWGSASYIDWEIAIVR